MRIDIGDDLHTARFEPRDRVGGGGLDPVDLAGQQRGGTGRGFRHRDQHQPVVLRNALLVPVFGVRHQFEPLMRHEAVVFVGTGAGGVQRVLRPIVIHFLGPARADHQDVAERVRKQRFDEIVFERDRVIVDFGDRFDVGQKGAGVGELLGGKVGRLLVHAHLKIPDDVVGLEVAAIMPFDAVTQVDDPPLIIARIGLVGGREAGPDLGRLVGFRQIPQQQPVVEVVADETITLETLIGIPCRHGDVAGGHRDGQRAAGMR